MQKLSLDGHSIRPGVILITKLKIKIYNYPLNEFTIFKDLKVCKPIYPGLCISHIT